MKHAVWHPHMPKYLDAVLPVMLPPFSHNDSCSSDTIAVHVSPGETSGVKALQLPNGQLLRVETGAQPADFQRDMNQADSHSAAAAALGVMAAAEGIEGTPQALLAAYAQV